MQLGPGRLPGPNFFPRGERNLRLGGVYQIESGSEGGGCHESCGNPVASRPLPHPRRAPLPPGPGQVGGPPRGPGPGPGGLSRRRSEGGHPPNPPQSPGVAAPGPAIRAQPHLLQAGPAGRAGGSPGHPPPRAGRRAGPQFGAGGGPPHPAFAPGPGDPAALLRGGPVLPGDGRPAGHPPVHLRHPAGPGQGPLQNLSHPAPQGGGDDAQ